MRKLNLRYLYTAVAAAALTAAAITIPAWAAGGGDSSGQTQSGTQTSRAPLPFPPGGGFAVRANAPSAAEIKQSRTKLDEFASCLKDHGVDALPPGSLGQRPQAPSSSEMKQITKECGTPPAPPAGLPPLSKKHVEEARKAMAKGDCPPLPAPPARSSK